MKAIILLLVLFYSGLAAACLPAKVSWEDRVSQATQIATGFVSGKILTDFEASILGTQTSIQPTEAYQLRVIVSKNLKGKFSTNIIKPIIANCGAGGGKLKQKVLVFYDGTYWFVRKYNDKLVHKLTEIINNLNAG